MTESSNRPRDAWDESGQGVVEPEEGGDALFGAVNFVLRHRWRIVLGAVLFAGITIPLKMSQPRTYTSTSRFVTESGTGRAADLTGLAAQFGISLGGEANSYSPQFYVDLVTSSVILRQAVDHKYTVPSSGGPRALTLVEYYETQVETPERSRELAVRELRDNLTAELSVKTGVIQLSVTARHPDVAAQINRRLLDLLDRFNVETRRSRASDERRFIQERMAAVGSELRTAEARVEDFLRRNRQYQNSPELRFEYDRLNTAFVRTSQVYNSLAQALEQAKVDEIRDTPVLTVVEPPVPPRWPNGRGTLRAGILALLLGAIVGLGFGFLTDQWRARTAAGTEESREYRRLLRDTLYDIRRILTFGLWRRRSTA